MKSEAVFMATNPYIEITPGIVGGKPRVAGHRIAVQNIAIWHERMGKSVDEIADEYDLTLAEVYAALAYYFAHREEIDKSIEEGQAFVGAMRKCHAFEVESETARTERMSKIRYHTDEHVSKAVARALQRRGVDVQRTP